MIAFNCLLIYSSNVLHNISFVSLILFPFESHHFRSFYFVFSLHFISVHFIPFLSPEVFFSASVFLPLGEQVEFHLEISRTWVRYRSSPTHCMSITVRLICSLHLIFFELILGSVFHLSKGISRSSESEKGIYSLDFWQILA